MKRRSVWQQLLLGLSLGLLFLFQTSAVNAWPVWVVGNSSPTEITQAVNSTKSLIEQTSQTFAQLKLVANSDLSFAGQIAEYAKVAGRWLQTVQHYTEIINQSARRFTALKGIMGFTEQMLGFDEDTLKAMAEIGQAVRGVMALQKQFNALLHTRIAMFESWASRAKQGIFNPEADLRDLEDYLLNSVGRQSQATLQSRAKLTKDDQQLARWTSELELLRQRETELLKLKDEYAQRLESETQRQLSARLVGADGSGQPMPQNGQRFSASAEAINALQAALINFDAELVEIRSKIQKLLDQIEERYRFYVLAFGGSWQQAEAIQQANRGWERFNGVKLELTNNLLGIYGQP